MGTQYPVNEDFFDCSKYKKSRMDVKVVTYELCDCDCPYYQKKHEIK